MTEVFFQPQQWRYEGIVCLKGKRTQSDSRHFSRRRNLPCLVVFLFKTLCVFYVIENVYLPFNKVHEKITQFWLRQFSGNSMQKKVNPVQRSNKLDWLCENIIVYYCFDRTRLFWPNAPCHLLGLNKLFLHLMRALLLHNYDKLSRIFHGYY